ncbi:MAG TPA: MmcQ/YjbR family DNA-binding protein [Caulobacteraceae bacterium]
MTREEMREICLSFPSVVEGTSYGRPSFLVNKKFFTRLRDEDASVVLLEVGFDEREMLIEAEPRTFHFTAHYKDYPAVLARIATLHPGSFRNILERRWRKIAPKALVRAREAAPPSIDDAQNSS